MLIKESFVYRFRWVGCNGVTYMAKDCGYERSDDASNYYDDGGFKLLRMFKFDGVQYCEECLRETVYMITEALEEE